MLGGVVSTLPILTLIQNEHANICSFNPILQIGKLRHICLTQLTIDNSVEGLCKYEIHIVIFVTGQSVLSNDPFKPNRT